MQRKVQLQVSRDACFMCHLMISGYRVFVLVRRSDGPFTDLRSLHPQKYHCDVSDRTSSDGCLSSKPMSFLVGVTYILISSSCQPMFTLYRLAVGLYMIGCGFPNYVLVAIAICFILTSMDRCLPMDDGRFVEAFAGTSPWHSS